MCAPSRLRSATRKSLGWHSRWPRVGRSSSSTITIRGRCGIRWTQNTLAGSPGNTCSKGQTSGGSRSRKWNQPAAIVAAAANDQIRVRWRERLVQAASQVKHARLQMRGAFLAMKISLVVNGQPVEKEVSAVSRLSGFLRDVLGLKGVKEGSRSGCLGLLTYLSTQA